MNSTSKHSAHSRPRRSRFRIGTVTLTALASVSLSLWLANERDGNEHGDDPQEAASSTADGVVRQAGFGVSAANGRLCSFVPGTRMAYDVRSRTRVELQPSSLSEGVDLGSGQAQVVASPTINRDIERDWRLELEAIATDSNGSSVLAARIEDRGIRSFEGETPTASPALSDTFLIRVDARCGILEYGWRADGDLDAAREQQIMAGGLGFVAPAALGEPSRYAAAGFDETGRYQAKFDYDEDGRIHGEALAFAPTPAAFGGAQLDIELLSSNIEATLAPGLWFESLANERDLELNFFGTKFGTHFRSTTAKRASLGEFAPQVDLDDGGWRWGVLGAGPVSERESFDPALRGVPLDDALARYQELVAGGSVADYGPMLRDWLRANPEATGDLVAILRSGAFDADQAARAGVFYALGAANTDEARGALIGMIDSTSDEIRDQISAARALTLVDAPTQEMVDLLADASARDGYHEIERGSMALALGTFAARSETHDPAVAAAARAEIRGWLDAPSDDEAALGHSLLAAGNAGHDELASSVTPYLEHENPTIRSQAAHAMRKMSPQTAYPALEASLLDEDRVVRTAAFESAASVAREHDSVPSQALTSLAGEALASESQAERGAAIGLLREAAKRGDNAANELLEASLREQLVGARDPQQLALLGQSVAGTWRP